jgi:hypothetical protein
VRDAFDANGASYDTESSSESGGLCAWKALATNGTMNESSAGITLAISVPGDPETEYDVHVQMVVESNTTANNCSTRTYESDVRTVTLQGGESHDIEKSLSAMSGETKCLIHTAVIAYEA